MDTARLIADAFGVTLVNAIGLLIFVVIGKTLFAKTVDAAAAKALEKKKHEFAQELEEIRQRFAREVESERSAFQLRLEFERKDAARALEEFKADLTLGAEVRRQIAQRKVAALLDIVSKGEPLIRAALNRSAKDTAPPMQPFNEFMILIRQHQYLLTKETAQALHTYNGKMAKCMIHWDEKHDYESVEEAGRVADHFLELVRSELGIG